MTTYQREPPPGVLGALVRPGDAHQPGKDGAHSLLLPGVKAGKGIVGAAGDGPTHFTNLFVGVMGQQAISSLPPP